MPSHKIINKKSISNKKSIRNKNRKRNKKRTRNAKHISFYKKGGAPTHIEINSIFY